MIVEVAVLVGSLDQENLVVHALRYFHHKEYVRHCPLRVYPITCNPAGVQIHTLLNCVPLEQRRVHPESYQNALRAFRYTRMAVGGQYFDLVEPEINDASPRQP